MSESVWYEQVDTALIKYLKDTIKLTDSFGDLTPIPVEVRKPDNDFKIETYPCITIYNLYDRYAVTRQGYSRKVVGRDYDKSKILLERSSVPYDLYYQIDFWSKTITDMNTMTRLWLSEVPRFFNLSVKDMNGNDRSCFVLKTDDLKKADYVSGNLRYLHSFITYKVQVELDENVVGEYPMVTEIQADVNKRR